MAANARSPSLQEIEAEGSEVWGHLQLYKQDCTSDQSKKRPFGFINFRTKVISRMALRLIIPIPESPRHEECHAFEATLDYRVSESQ